jgi:hypothetical protein
MLAAAIILISGHSLAEQVKSDIVTEKGETHDAPIPHSLGW